MKSRFQLFLFGRYKKTEAQKNEGPCPRVQWKTDTKQRSDPSQDLCLLGSSRTPTGLYSQLARISSSSQGSWCPLQQASQGEKYLKGRKKSKTMGSKKYSSNSIMISTPLFRENRLNNSEILIKMKC